VQKSYSTFVRVTLLTLPITTIVTGVTGLRLYGVLVGAELPLRFATTHPHQVRRQGVEVTRVKHLPPRRGHIAVPEHCWNRDIDRHEDFVRGHWTLTRATKPAISAHSFQTHNASLAKCTPAALA